MKKSLKELLRLDGRVAVVTGGAGFLGRSICRGLAESGAAVVVASRDESSCRHLADELIQDGMLALGVALDLGRADSINRLFDPVIERFGRADILVNNAVHWSPQGALPDVAEAPDWEESMRVDGTGLMLICQAFARSMKVHGRGSIINITSIHGVLCPNWGVPPEDRPRTPATYPYVKSGMVGYTKMLAGYFAPFGIRANCLGPAGFPGRSGSTLPPGAHNYYHLNTPLGRFGRAPELKGAVVYLASDASSYVTGATLMVDGGWTAW